MSAYGAFRDSVAWQPRLSDPEYPGAESFGAEQSVPGRVSVATRDVGGDQIASETVWTLPEHEPAVGDLLNGGKVIAVEAAKDAAGNVRWWSSAVER